MREYHAIAPLYDLFLEPFIHHIRLALVAWVQEHRPGQILDIGCGTGKQISLFPREFTAFGIDISRHMLREAKKKIRGRCLKSDVASLPFPGDSFDLVYSQFAFHEKSADTVGKASAEVRRVLSATGRLIVVDFAVPARTTLFTRVICRSIRVVEANAGEEHFQNYRAWMSAGGIDRVMTNHGWNKLEERSYFFGTIKMIVFNKSRKEGK